MPRTKTDQELPTDDQIVQPFDYESYSTDRAKSPQPGYNDSMITDQNPNSARRTPRNPRIRGV
ncbi:MAG: hypothetical protein HYX63_16610 [Gammaproteobacteria bacterium]|nr:hypothetical protein [Gammaproteobacteria bacterium]